MKILANQLLQKVRQMPSIAYPYLSHVARDLGILKNHQDYTKFIILGRSRSGSNFLRGLLNSHSRVIAFGEIFQNDKAISWGLSGYPESEQLLAMFRTHPIHFLERELFGTFPKRIEAVGFKIFYYHAQNALWQPVWEYLAAQSQLKIIHIKRDNLLKLHLSRKKAILTERWVNLTGEKEPETPIILDYAECLADFTQTRAWEEQYDDLFANHAKLELCYEALAQDYQSEMQRVHQFLGVEPEVLIPETHRQSTIPLSRAIMNYAELKAKFSATTWHSFFED
jgi:LPS sulfotransferase NodH